MAEQILHATSMDTFPGVDIEFNQMFERLSAGEGFQQSNVLQPGHCLAIMGEISSIPDFQLDRITYPVDNPGARQYWVAEMTSVLHECSSQGIPIMPTLSNLAELVDRRMTAVETGYEISKQVVSLNVFKPGDYLSKHYDDTSVSIVFSLDGLALNLAEGGIIMPGTMNAHRGLEWASSVNNSSATEHGVLATTPRTSLVFRYELFDPDW